MTRVPCLLSGRAPGDHIHLIFLICPAAHAAVGAALAWLASAAEPRRSTRPSPGTVGVVALAMADYYTRRSHRT